MIAKQKADAAAKAVAPTATTTAAQANPPTTAKPVAGIVKGLRFGKAIAASVQAEPGPAIVPTIPEVVESGVMTLDDLNDTTDAGLEPTSQFAFQDEIPADAPDRELPEGLGESQLAFVTLLNSVYEVMHDPELFGQMIRTIMQEMQEHPDYMDLVADQDVHVMIRGLRSSMGLAKIKKAEKSTKSRAGKASPKTPEMVNTLDEMFNADQW